MILTILALRIIITIIINYYYDLIGDYDYDDYDYYYFYYHQYHSLNTIIINSTVLPTKEPFK